jgi:hypothetical protein
MKKAFITYSHAADGKLAPALQSGLQRIAKPFYRLRAMRIFRDETSLSLTPKLWPMIQKSIGESEHFILMASPRAADSQWVRDEIGERLRVRGGSVDKFHIVLTEGDIVWDKEAKDFDWEKTTALPESLRGRFETEPFYLDFRWAREAEHLSLRNPQFLKAIGKLAAAVRGQELDAIVGEDVHQHRIFKLAAGATIALLSGLLVIASATAFYANERRKEADGERRKAVDAAQRERQAAENERVAREEERRQREQAEKATKNEKEARDEADRRRKDAEEALGREKVATARAAEAARQEGLAKNQAEEKRKEAEQRSREALSRQLAAQSRSKLEYEIDLASFVSPKATPVVESGRAGGGDLGD